MVHVLRGVIGENVESDGANAKSNEVTKWDDYAVNEHSFVVALFVLISVKMTKLQPTTMSNG